MITFEKMTDQELINFCHENMLGSEVCKALGCEQWCQEEDCPMTQCLNRFEKYITDFEKEKAEISALKAQNEVLYSEISKSKDECTKFEERIKNSHEMLNSQAAKIDYMRGQIEAFRYCIKGGRDDGKR